MTPPIHAERVFGAWMQPFLTMRIRGLKPMSLAGLLPALALSACAAPLQFNRDVRPILSENCFHCHGQDEARREGKLRLDERESAVRAVDGIAAIVPGNPEESEVFRRITAPAAADIMPPPESHRTLNAAQIDVLRRWISEGAEYQGHWSLQVPVREPVPTLRSDGAARGPKNEIDRLRAQYVAVARLGDPGFQPQSAV